MRARLCIFFLLFLPFLTASDPSPQELASVQGAEAVMIDGCVNAITGDLILQQVDGLIQGREPIPIKRRYISREMRAPHLAWKAILHGTAVVFRQNKTNYAFVPEENGITIRYDPDPSRPHLYPRKSIFRKGVVNQPGYSPIHNQVKISQKILKVQYSNGGYRLYKRIKKEKQNGIKKHEYLLQEEKLINGNLIKYQWKKLGPYFQIESIQTTSPDGSKEYARIEIDLNETDCTLKGSDGQKISYHSTQFKVPKHYPLGGKKGEFLTKIKAAHHPKEKHKRNKSLLVEKRVLPEGREQTFEYGPNDKVHCIRYPDGSKTKITYKEGETTVIHPNKNTTQYVFDPETLRLERIEFSEKRENLVRIETYSWTKEGYLEEKRVLEPDTTPVYTESNIYDTEHNLTQKTIKGPGVDTTYSYNYDPLKRLIERRDDNGRVISYSYHEKTILPLSKQKTKNQTLLVETHYIYDQDNQLLTKTKTDAAKTLSWHYTNRNEPPFLGLIETIEKRCNDHFLYRIHLNYDQWGNIAKKTYYDSEERPRYTTQTDYNKKGQVLRETNPLGHITTYQYNKNHHPTLITHPKGLETHYEYDTRDRLTEKRQIVDNEAYQTLLTYDKTPQPTKIEDPLKGTQTLGYHPLGQPSSRHQDPGPHIEYKRNALGHIIEEIHFNPHPIRTQISRNARGDPLTIIHPDGTTEKWTYNKDGTKKSYQDQNGTTNHYSYDALGHIIQEEIHAPNGEILGQISRAYLADQLMEETDLEGQKTCYTYNEKNELIQKNYEDQVTTYTYDRLGRCIEEQRDDHRVRKTLDLLGREIEAKEYSNDLLLTHIKTQYDPDGNIIKKTYYPQNQKAQIHYAYDLLGRKTEILLPEGEKYRTHYTLNPQRRSLISTTQEPEGIQTLRETDSHDNLLSLEKQDQTGQTLKKTTYRYDRENNPIQETSETLTLEKTYTDKNELETLTENREKTTRYTYTPTGQIAILEKPDGTLLTYHYNPLGHLIQDQLYTYKRDKSGKLLESTTTKRTLDKRGNILEETLGNSFTLTSTYDNLDRRASLTLPNDLTITYTYLGPYLHSVTLNGKTHTYKRDLAGNIIEETHFDGAKTQIHYDKNQRPKAIRHPNYAQTLSYSPRGNIHTIECNSQTTTYSYDLLDHLIEEPAHQYSYDSLHNRTHKDQTAYILNTQNQYTHIEYDPNGNPTQKGDTTYEYDELDRLIRITTPQGTTHYTYDSEHRRISKNKVLYIWDQDHELGTLDTYRILGEISQAEIGAAIAIIKEKETYIPYHDLFGNLIRAGPYTQDFTAFGEGAATLPWGFSSKRHDPESQLIYFGRRYYEPELGRFLTPDPAGYTDTLNLYAYTQNNPLSLHDPYGLTPMYMWQKPAFLESPRFQGGIQAIGGLSEAGIGAAMTYGSYGLAAPAGCALMAHGLDQYQTGMRTLFTGQYQTTATQQILEKTGMPRNWASFTNDAMSLVGSMGGTAIYRAGVRGSFPYFQTSTPMSATYTTLDRPATSSMSAHLLKNKLIAEEIASGHAYPKHVIKKGEFPGFSQKMFQWHIQNILDHPTEMKLLSRGRTAYWDEVSGTVVLRDPPRIDGGTAFKPLQGKKYYDDILR